jgi:hypothetical protein
VQLVVHNPASDDCAQRRTLAEHELDAEVHVKSDYVQIAYRKLRKKYLESDWMAAMPSIDGEVRIS